MDDLLPKKKKKRSSLHKFDIFESSQREIKTTFESKGTESPLKCWDNRFEYL